MTTITLTLNGNSSLLSADYFPPIELGNTEYECGLVNLCTWHSIPNIDETNNVICIDNSNNNNNKGEEGYEFLSFIDTKIPHFTWIPYGAYEIEDLAEYLKNQLKSHGINFDLKVNKSTMKCQLFCDHAVDFSKSKSLGKLLGFGEHYLVANKPHISYELPEISKLNVIRVECDITKGAYFNNQQVHTIHEFPVKVDPGYKIIETPKNIIYFPVSVKSIHHINISLIDQNNNPINFQGEPITVRVHLKPVQ